MPDYFDIHSHLNFPEDFPDAQEVIDRMRAEKIWTIGVGANITSSRTASEQTALYEGLFACVGLHPGEETGEEFLEENYEYLMQNPKVVAIGECGLDYFRLPVSADTAATESVQQTEKARQKKLFETQIDFAVRFGRPIMIHCRNSSRDIQDAQFDILTILETKKAEHGEGLWGNAHFFSGTPEIAARYLALNFSLSFTGVITFTPDYDEAVRTTPLSMIMSETDSPYVAPVPHRGARNEPTYVTEVVKRIAEIRGEDFETVRQAMVQNAKRVFKIA